jgi:two-component system, NarL family, invasion response regulator UvrY
MGGKTILRILIVDDHAVVRRGLREILSEDPNTVLVAGEAADCDQALAQLQASPWDAVLLDISLPGRGGLDVLQEIKTRHPSLPVLVLSVHPEEQYAVRVLRAGAAGYLNKDAAPTDLASAVKKITSGGRYVTPSLAERLAAQVAAPDQRPPHEQLSDREFEVLRRIASGRTVSEIAEDLHLSVKTVSTYRTRILAKMGMRTNAELTHYAIKNALV